MSGAKEPEKKGKKKGKFTNTLEHRINDFSESATTKIQTVFQMK